MSNNSTIIAETLLARFKEGLGKYSKPKMSDFYSVFLEVVVPYISENMQTAEAQKGSKGKVKADSGAGAAGGAKGKRVKKEAAEPKEAKDKKFDTWSRCWASTEFGGKARFVDDYNEIKSAQKALKDAKSDELVGDSHFSVLKLLRDRLESEDGQTRWVEWSKWVQEINPDAPAEAPSERKPKRETKKSAAAAAAATDETEVSV